MKQIDSKIIAEGIHYCIENAEKYYKTAKKLIADNPDIAYLLFLYSLEEIGKVQHIFNAPFYRDSEKNWESWKKRFKDHEEKFWSSKDMDDHMNRIIASKENKKEAIKAKIKLSISYVDFDGVRFQKPNKISLKDLNEVSGSCRKRLEFLSKNHSSIEETTEMVSKAINMFGGLTNNQIIDMRNNSNPIL